MNKSKLISVIIIAVIFIAIHTNISHASTGIVTTETLRIRKEPNTKSSILEMANADDEVEIISKEGNWYKIKYKNVEGYVLGEYVKVDEKAENTADNSESETPTPTPSESTKPKESETPKESEEPEVTPSTTPSTKPSETPSEEPKEEPEEEMELSNTINKKTNGYLLPNLSSIKLVELQKGKKVAILNTISNWSKVTIDNQEVWVANTYLMKTVSDDKTTPTNNNNETKPAEEEKPKDDTKTAYVSVNSAINLRTKKSTSSEVIILEESGDWYKVKYNNDTGYILKRLVTVNSESSRSMTQSRTAEQIQKVEPKEENSETEQKEEKTDTKQEETEKVEEKKETQTTSNSNTSKGTAIVNTAKKYLNGKYVSGGSSPKTGFDCSGLTQYVYSENGISIPRTASTQYASGKKVSKKNVTVGDLVFFSDNGKESGIYHVGIYIGNGNFIHAANSKRGIVINSLNGGDNYGYNKSFIGVAEY